MKKFDMTGAVYKSNKNVEQLKKEICENKPLAVTEDQEEEVVTMVEIDCDSELPPELSSLQSLVSSIAPGKKVQMTEEKFKALAKWAKSNRMPGAAMEAPMDCVGKKCKYADRCPLIANGINVEPFTECPLERHLMNQWVSDMSNSIAAKPGDKLFAPDIRSINHSAMLELILRRTTMELAKDPEVIKKVVIGINDQGQAIEGEELNSKISAIQSLMKTEDKIHESLLATRKAKASAGENLTGDTEDYLEGAAAFAETVNEQKHDESSGSSKEV